MTAYNVEHGFTKLYQEPEEILGRRIAGGLYGKHAICPLLAPRDFWDKAEVSG